MNRQAFEHWCLENKDKSYRELLKEKRQEDFARGTEVIVSIPIPKGNYGSSPGYASHVRGVVTQCGPTFFRVQEQGGDRTWDFLWSLRQRGFGNAPKRGVHGCKVEVYIDFIWAEYEAMKS